MKRIKLPWISLILLSLIPLVAYTYLPPESSTSFWSLNLGGAAENLLNVEKSAGSFIHFICMVAGVGLLLASVNLFYSHWQNPANVPLSKPVAMVFFGLALIGLSFIPMGL